MLPCAGGVSVASVSARGRDCRSRRKEEHWRCCLLISGCCCATFTGVGATDCAALAGIACVMCNRSSLLRSSRCLKLALLGTRGPQPTSFWRSSLTSSFALACNSPFIVDVTLPLLTRAHSARSLAFRTGRVAFCARHHEARAPALALACGAWPHSGDHPRLAGAAIRPHSLGLRWCVILSTLLLA
mgnify:CR=1 FL=1